MSLLAEVLLTVEVETVLAVSELLVTIPHESMTLEEEKNVVLSSGVLAASWYSWGLFS